MESSSDLPELLMQRRQDGELVRRVALGDREASRILVDRFLRSIVRFAYRILGDVAEAEDVAQETFLRLWRTAGEWEPRAKLSTWLHQVARNLCIDRLRGSRSVALGELSDAVDLRPGAAAQLESRQREDAVQRALLSVAERQRTAIVLVYYQGLSNREAADVMEIEVDALESLLARGRRSMRDRLVGFGETMDRGGVDRSGVDRSGVDRSRMDQGGVDQSGVDLEGFPRKGKHQKGTSGERRRRP